jgi:hypothetical protein
VGIVFAVLMVRIVLMMCVVLGMYSVFSTWFRWNNKHRNYIRQHSRKKAGKNDNKDPNESNQNRVNIEIFAQASDYPGQHLIRFAFVEMFHRKSTKICNKGTIANLISIIQPRLTHPYKLLTVLKKYGTLQLERVYIVIK